MFLAFVEPESVRGFFRALSVTLVISALAMVPLPAVGELASAPHVADLMRLRNGSFHQFDLMKTEGLISMPSYHAIMGTLTVLACWLTPARWPVFAFNVVMLFATVHSGAHYLVDVIAGILLALFAARVVKMPALTGGHAAYFI
jgi:membrane-associated phospholipid phosphatase